MKNKKIKHNLLPKVKLIEEIYQIKNKIIKEKIKLQIT